MAVVKVVVEVSKAMFLIAYVLGRSTIPLLFTTKGGRGLLACSTAFAGTYAYYSMDTKLPDKFTEKQKRQSEADEKRGFIYLGIGLFCAVTIYGFPWIINAAKSMNSLSYGLPSAATLNLYNYIIKPASLYGVKTLADYLYDLRIHPIKIIDWAIYLPAKHYRGKVKDYVDDIDKFKNLYGYQEQMSTIDSSQLSNLEKVNIDLAPVNLEKYLITPLAKITVLPFIGLFNSTSSARFKAYVTHTSYLRVISPITDRTIVPTLSLFGDNTATDLSSKIKESAFLQVKFSSFLSYYSFAIGGSTWILHKVASRMFDSNLVYFSIGGNAISNKAIAGPALYLLSFTSLATSFISISLNTASLGVSLVTVMRFADNWYSRTNKQFEEVTTIIATSVKVQETNVRLITRSESKEGSFVNYFLYLANQPEIGKVLQEFAKFKESKKYSDEYLYAFAIKLLSTNEFQNLLSGNNIDPNNLRHAICLLILSAVHSEERFKYCVQTLEEDEHGNKSKASLDINHVHGVINQLLDQELPDLAAAPDNNPRTQIENAYLATVPSIENIKKPSRKGKEKQSDEEGVGSSSSSPDNSNLANNISEILEQTSYIQNPTSKGGIMGMF